MYERTTKSQTKTQTTNRNKSIITIEITNKKKEKIYPSLFNKRDFKLNNKHFSVPIHASIVRSTNERRKKRVRANFTVDFQQRFHYPPREKIDFIARAITLVANCFVDEIGGCLSRKHARNLSDGGISLSFSLSEVSFADLSPGTRSHLSLPRFAILSPSPSRNVPRSVIDYRLSVKLLLSLWPIVIPSANSSEDRSPSNRWRW